MVHLQDGSHGEDGVPSPWGQPPRPGLTIVAKQSVACLSGLALHLDHLEHLDHIDQSADHLDHLHCPDHLDHLDYPDVQVIWFKNGQRIDHSYTTTGARSENTFMFLAQVKLFFRQELQNE